MKTPRGIGQTIKELLHAQKNYDAVRQRLENRNTLAWHQKQVRNKEDQLLAHLRTYTKRDKMDPAQLEQVADVLMDVVHDTISSAVEKDIIDEDQAWELKLDLAGELVKVLYEEFRKARRLNGLGE